VVARSPALLRTAWMLTGDTATAEDLLQTALAKTWPHWGPGKRWPTGGLRTTRWNAIPKHMCHKLRTRRPIRKNKKNTVKGQWRSQIINARPIDERPAAAENRSALGHQEGDLIIGAKVSQVATLVDRKSRFLTMVKLKSRHTAAVIPALTEAYARMDSRLHGTLTWGTSRPPNWHKRRT